MTRMAVFLTNWILCVDEEQAGRRSVTRMAAFVRKWTPCVCGEWGKKAGDEEGMADLSCGECKLLAVRLQGSRRAGRMFELMWHRWFKRPSGGDWPDGNPSKRPAECQSGRRA